LEKEKENKMKRLLLFCFAQILMLAPAMAQAQETNAPPAIPSPRIQRLVTLKYADPQSVRNLLSIFNLGLTVDSRMRVIAMEGPKERVDAAEEAIKKLDVPSAAAKNIELTAYFVMGTDEPTRYAINGVAPAEGRAGAAIPQDLQGVVAQLKNTFPYKAYGLLDILSLQTRAGGGAETSGNYGSRFTVFKIRAANLDADGAMVRLEGFHAGLKNPVKMGDKTDFVDTGITTDVVDVKEGQKVVVGRGNLDGPGTALFLVLMARVIQ
jgi:hypothetical protein